MQTKVEGKNYVFTDEGFQIKPKSNIIKYSDIIQAKKDVTYDTYSIKYLDDKGKNKKAEFNLDNGQVEIVDQILKNNKFQVEVRNRTFFECGKMWFCLFGVVGLMAAIIICLITGVVESARVPVIFIPFIKWGINLGLKKVIIITIVSGIISLSGTIFSYSRRKQIEILRNVNHI